MEKNLKNISGLLLEKWKKDELIDEIQVRGFFDCILDNLLQIPQEESLNYKKYSDKICELWHYREFEKLSKEEVFLYGGIWGSIKLMARRRERLQRDERLASYITKYKNNDSILKHIYYHPGIKHKDLAKKLKKTPSQLSQQIRSFEREGLIINDRMGREKYYYLLNDGEHVYTQIRKSKEEKEKENYIEVKVVPSNIIRQTSMEWNTVSTAYKSPLNYGYNLSNTYLNNSVLGRETIWGNSIIVNSEQDEVRYAKC